MFNNVIKSNEFDTVIKLQENIEMLESRLTYMQSVNDYYKENNTTLGHPEVPNETAMELDKRVKDGQATPYPGQFFTENRKEIDRLKAVIERIQTKPETVFKSWEFNGGEAVVNLANNRLQLFFEERPTDEQLNTLKKNGFKWGSRSKCWQRQLTHKSFEACDKINFIKPKDGINPSDLQPKTPKRNEPER